MRRLLQAENGTVVFYVSGVRATEERRLIVISSANLFHRLPVGSKPCRRHL